jgi:DNA-directed RNA polymerase subunit omega
LSSGDIPMARITIEDCLERVENRYELVHLATKRVKQLREGAEPLVKSKNKEVVTALREIAAGKIKHAPISEYDSDEF